MLMGFVASLGTLALGQSAASGGVAGIVVVIAIVAAVAAVLMFLRARSLGADVAATRRQSAETQAALKALQARERELTKKSEDRHEELRELKQELAGLRKKHHAAQEESKSLREQLKSQAEERDRMLSARPAFEPVKVEPKPKPAPQPVAPPPPAAPVAVVAPPPAAAAVSPDPELLDRIAKLEAERTGLVTTLAAAREARERHEAELSRLRRYAEQLRRIDMISKGKVEILEDKVAALGRQYYEAVSELAAMKGEVVPPRPRSETKPRPVRRADGQDSGDSEHATPESDALAAQMDAADAEAAHGHDPGEHGEGDESPGEPRASEA